MNASRSVHGDAQARAAAGKPAATTLGAEPTLSAAIATEVEAKPERARVLVVDDDDRNLLAIRTVIEDLAEVEVATSGDEALRHLLKSEFAVILLDVYIDRKSVV